MGKGDGRLHDRAPIEVGVHISSVNNFYAGVSNDISQGGVFVASPEPPPVGSLIEVVLTMPNSKKPYRAHGIVRWVRGVADVAAHGGPMGCGIQWLCVPAGMMRDIESFVAERETILYDDSFSEPQH